MKEILLVKVGNDNHPASEKDIAAANRAIRKVLVKGAPYVMVTHHAMTIETVQVPDSVTEFQIKGQNNV